MHFHYSPSSLKNNATSMHYFFFFYCYHFFQWENLTLYKLAELNRIAILPQRRDQTFKRSFPPFFFLVVASIFTFKFLGRKFYLYHTNQGFYYLPENNVRNKHKGITQLKSSNKKSRAVGEFSIFNFYFIIYK